MSHKPCSEQYNNMFESPCLGFLPPPCHLTPPSSGVLLLPEACFANTNQPVQSSEAPNQALYQAPTLQTAIHLPNYSTARGQTTRDNLHALEPPKVFKLANTLPHPLLPWKLQ